MSNNKKQNNKMNMPKFSLNWMYAIIALMLIGLYLSSEGGSMTKPISYSEFQQYVRNGYASKVVTYNDNTVELYIKPEHIKDVFKQDASKVGTSPVVTSRVPSNESVSRFLEKEKDEARFQGKRRIC